jgi:hypothetical protein
MKSLGLARAPPRTLGRIIGIPGGDRAVYLGDCILQARTTDGAVVHRAAIRGGELCHGAGTGGRRVASFPSKCVKSRRATCPSSRSGSVPSWDVATRAFRADTSSVVPSFPQEIRRCLKYWDRLTLFLHQPGAPPDLTVVEWVLKEATGSDDASRSSHGRLVSRLRIAKGRSSRNESMPTCYFRTASA